MGQRKGSVILPEVFSMYVDDFVMVMVLSGRSQWDWSEKNDHL